MTGRFARLLRLETRLLLRQASFWWLFLPLTAALLIAAHLGALRMDASTDALRQARNEEQRIEALAADTARRLADPAAPEVDFYRDPTGAYSYMTMFLVRHAVKPAYPLAPLAIGLSDVQPSNLRMTFGFSAIFTDDFAAIGSPRALKLGGFDMAFVLIYLLPLALIAVSAPRLSFEQDSGILRMISAQPVAIATVAAAKFGAVAIVFLVWLAVAGAAALAVGGMLPLAAGWGAALSWLALAVALYGLFWIGIGALAAGLWQGGRVAIGVAFSLWAAFTFLLPAAAALAASAWIAPISRVAYIDASRQAVDRFYAEGPAISRAWAATHPQLATRPDLATTTEVTRFARDHYFREILAPYRAEFGQRQEEMAALASRISVISPSLILRHALEGASGTDTGRHGRFLADADRFGQDVRAYFHPRIVGALLHPPEKCAGCTAQLNFDSYDEVPRFTETVDPASATEAARKAVPALLAFVLLLGMLLTVQYRGARGP